MSYREIHGSDSNRLPRRWAEDVGQHTTSNAHDGTRVPDAPQRPLAKSAERRAVPLSVCSWDSNPWSHVRATNSPMADTRVPIASTRSMTEALPQKRRKPPGETRRLFEKIPKNPPISANPVRNRVAVCGSDRNAQMFGWGQTPGANRPGVPQHDRNARVLS